MINQNYFSTRQSPWDPSRKSTAERILREFSDNGFGVNSFLSLEEQALRDQLIKQVEEAFSKSPSPAGVITGRREIKLGKRGVGRPSHFPSKKNAVGSLSVVSLPVESRMESMYALELERNRNVKAFRTQAIELAVPGADAPTYPDFLVVDASGRLHLREVKADKRYLSTKTQLRTERFATVLPKLGFSYAVVDATDMSCGMKSVNLFRLHKQYSQIPHADEVAQVIALDFAVIAFGMLKKWCGQLGIEPSIVPYLLFTEQLNTHWEVLINDQTEVWK